jgi:uncharacterized protein (TIGR02271 family)
VWEECAGRAREKATIDARASSGNARIPQEHRSCSARFEYMTERTEIDTAIPLVEERLVIDKRAVETGRVRIRTIVGEKLARVSEELERDDVTIERVPINKEVTQVPEVREEDGVLIVPLLEEVVVVEKRLVLKEELRVTRLRKRERVEQAMQVRTMDADVRRVRAAPASDSAQAHDADGVRTRPRLRRKDPPASGRK